MGLHKDSLPHFLTQLGVFLACSSDPCHFDFPPFFRDEERDTPTCDGIKVGQNISYDVTIEVRECPKNEEDWKKTMSIYPVGLAEELKIHLEYKCACDCEASDLGVSKNRIILMLNFK